MSEQRYDQVDVFTAGALGEPGHRLFLLQVVAGTEVITVKAEKVQVARMATYFAELLADLARPGHLPEDLDLRYPVDFDWAAGAISIVYDDVTDRLKVSIIEMGDEPEQLDLAALTFDITREQAAAFAIHATSVVEAGRPACPLCGHPIDPDGHACPRTNGNRPPAL